MTIKDKLNLAVFYGGQSPEHDISCITAKNVIAKLNKSKYNVTPIYITRSGEWLINDQAISIKPITNGALLTTPDGNQIKLDAAFPLLHGPGGEDGTIQGLLEILNTPYVGCDTLASAATMNKATTKEIWQSQNLPVAKFLSIHAPDWSSNKYAILEKVNKLQKPWFVKPANQGSSIGFTKAKRSDDLEPAIDLAFSFDDQIVIEEAIEGARDIEVALLGGIEPMASLPGEIIPENEFYDHHSKYFSNKTELVLPAKTSLELTEKLRELAKKAYRALNCYGMIRIDFLVRSSDDAIFLSEANAIPGFTEISLYPQLWNLEGISYPDLLDRLIELALQRPRTRHNCTGTANETKASTQK